MAVVLNNINKNTLSLGDVVKDGFRFCAVKWQIFRNTENTENHRN